MLNGYFHPKKNVVFERHVIFTETMHTSESVASYIVRLRKLAKTCQFDQYNIEQAILRTRFLKEESLTLESLSQIAAAHEQARTYSDVIESTEVRNDCVWHKGDAGCQ